MENIEIMLPGVAGFVNTSEDWGKQNNKEFEAYLFEAIRVESGELIEKDLLTNNKNFFTYQIRNRMETFYILLHSI